MTYNKVNPKQSFPELEKEVMKFWKENDTFKKSIENRNDSPEYTFYDGPPFATGTPHYGHILAGTIKDVIPRYQTMTGHKVQRVFGWDCHGLPIENIVEKKLNISGKSDIEDKVGVFEFNESCRSNVLTYTEDWKKTVERMGRWVDMENSYKTMDKEFMESVWWTFKSIYDKGLIYEGNRVVPYCPRCTTPLSNFEVNQGYKDKQDKTLTVKFKVLNNANKYILAWTTTPWTLRANLGLAVGKDIMYSEILDKKTGETYVLATDRLKSYYKTEEDYQIIREYKGACLEGIKYEPIFDDFDLQLNEMGASLGTTIKLGKNAYSVVIGHHVTTESGTGVVHIAPAYGEDDNIIGEKSELGFVSHIDDSGKTCNLLEHNGEFVFDFNDAEITRLKDAGKIVAISTIDHSYPHCRRCDTPLIYRAIPAWYVAVEKLKEKMIANNQKINWVPGAIKEGRFGKWLENARDWNISRNRYWGSAIPVWQNEAKTEEVCVGSIAELYELNKDFGQIEQRGDKYFYKEENIEIDLHKHFVDKILVKNPATGNTLKRIPEVLDCWFESGSMPYASKHYPFDNAENFKFPAEFIAEGLDQTRGWFYTLLIIGTALFDNTPFLNVIVNGIVLAEDGQKMSKSKKNYPDPEIIFDKYGADAMRFYLMNSPVVEAQDLRFSESGVEEVVKKVILPLWNTYYFFTTYANIDGFTAKEGNIYYVRHGETDNNKNHVVNGGDDDIDLNNNGIKQAHHLGSMLASSHVKFDYIVSSPMARAKNTATIIKSYLGYNIEIIEDEAFREQSYGEFKGMSHTEIIEKYKCKTPGDISRVYRNNSVEPLAKFEKRVVDGYKKLEENHAGKNILLVSHGGVFRPINKYISNLSDDEAYYQVAGAKNSKLYKLPNYERNNKLDRWIISELNKLTKDVKAGFDEYKLVDATRPIQAFMENLTNWYIRRSRKRFWKSENDNDKIEAYNTLHEVLVELSKVIAPFMPFVSEHIYKSLTGHESVHLENYPSRVPGFIFENLNKEMELTQKIVNLGLAFRANRKLRVRQPLSSITIGEKLDDYYAEIIKEELNVKEVIVLTDSSKIARKIAKPNAKLLGPKYGKDVQTIIMQAKSGNFEELENGDIKVGEFLVLEGEYEVAYEKADDSLDIEAGFGMAIAMDSVVTEELKLEGFARDIVRQVQEARKEAGFEVSDRIEISITSTDSVLAQVIARFSENIETETLSKIVSNIEKADLVKEIDLEELKFGLKLKK
ncbi:MAG: isoleucine--tRNA ligase [Candidatus Gracilibacteria bacterium]|nr:isoleucine--tRNA ligase [Candidatus Gracilibacteria bacterium]